DSLAHAKVLALNLCTNLDAELLRLRIAGTVDATMAQLCELSDVAGQPVVVDPAGATADGLAARTLDQLRQRTKAWLPMGGAGASNAWVIAGTRTRSGRPLVASDPHLPLQLPSVWHECHLVAPGLDVYGAALPGAPGVVIGHTPRVAWGFTNSGADVQDLYRERLDAAGNHRFGDHWLPTERVREVIRVRGGDDVVEEVLVTTHGPIVVGPEDGIEPMALRWTAYEPGRVVGTLLAMARAPDADAFRAALARWHCPPQNVVFADVAGRIAYQLAGAIPIRARGDGRLPAPGWSADHEWTGYIPFAELPASCDPERGWIVTANNRPCGPEYPHHLGEDFMNGWRAQRIGQLLGDRRDLTVDDCRRMQLDVLCLPGLVFAGHCRRLVPRDPIEVRALTELLAWNGQADAASRGAAVYETMVLTTARLIFAPMLGQELTNELLGYSRLGALGDHSHVLGRYTSLVLSALERWTAPPRSLHGDWIPLLDEALRDAVRHLRYLMGDDVDHWAWGRIHRMRLAHPLSSAPLIGRLLDGPSFAIGGDVDTVQQAAFAPHRPFGATGSAPSWRMVADLGQRSASGSVLPGGQWGQPRSRHYLDQLPLWRAGELHPHWTNVDEIRRNAVSTVTLRSAAPPPR
ncbi:MAG: penicillin acylase family protein, partial [Planctomycetes bacterium]|nr:penicillin acylase family protein [Planctomycetota bacterium]